MWVLLYFLIYFSILWNGFRLTWKRHTFVQKPRTVNKWEIFFQETKFVFSLFFFFSFLKIITFFCRDSTYKIFFKNIFFFLEKEKKKREKRKEQIPLTCLLQMNYYLSISSSAHGFRLMCMILSIMYHYKQNIIICSQYQKMFQMMVERVIETWFHCQQYLSSSTSAHGFCLMLHSFKDMSSFHYSNK